MSPRLRVVGYAASRAARGLRARPKPTALAVGAAAVALLVVASVQLVAANVRALASGWGGGVQMIVYLDDQATPEHGDAIAAALAQLPAVEQVERVEPAEAHARLRASLGDRGALLEDVDAGLLPTSLEVTLREGVGRVAEVSPAVDQLRRAPGVESVELLADWSVRLAALLDALTLLGWGVALIAALAGAWVIASAVELGLRGRRDELRVLESVGATAGFVRGSVVLEGALHGLLGASLGVALCWAVYAAGAGRIETSLAAAFGAASLHFLPLGHLTVLVAGGAAVGVVGGWFAAGGRRA